MKPNNKFRLRKNCILYYVINSIQGNQPTLLLKNEEVLGIEKIILYKGVVSMAVNQVRYNHLSAVYFFYDDIDLNNGVYKFVLIVKCDLRKGR